MLEGHPTIKAYLDKVRKDNLRFLVSAVAWNIMISAVPITIAMIALSKLVFVGGKQDDKIERELSRAFQGVLQPHYLDRVASMTVHHSVELGLLSVVAGLWGAWNVGFALSQSFNAMFEVGSRPFLREKLIDIAMFFVLMVLMFGIVAATSTQGAVSQTIRQTSLPNSLTVALNTGVSLGCAFVLFGVIYGVYPNTHKRMKIAHVWQGALLAAVLFQLLTYIWPLYEQHFQKYGGLLFPLLVLLLWIYFFSFILVLGGEAVAIIAIRAGQESGEEVGPAPSDNVPEHRTLPQGRKVTG
jgi:YihY family inner membrane protein